MRQWYSGLAAAVVVVAFSAGVASASGPHWIGPRSSESTRLDAVELQTLLAANRLKPEENIKALPLHRDAHNAAVLVQVRAREPRHYHADSNITVFMLEGQGVLHVDNQSFDMAAGDSALVPRGAPHYFVNLGTTPAAALVIYAPPPGKNDRVLMQ